MYSISQFSKLTRLSPRMLRHYDKIDLLKPQTIDSVNNYRYYSDSQVGTAVKIIKLKKYNFSLEEIKEILNSDELFFRKMVKEKIKFINETMRTEMDILEEMELYLKEGGKGVDKVNRYNIFYGMMEEQDTVKMRTMISMDEMDSVVDKLYDYALKNNLSPINAPIVSFLGEEYNDKKLDIEIFIPIKARPDEKFRDKEGLAEVIEGGNKVIIYKMPHHKVVSTIHMGQYDGIALAYQAIEKWIEESDFIPIGFTYEVYLRGSESIVPEKDFVTQICYGVE